MSPKEHFSLSTHIPSLQFIIELSDSIKGWAKGHVLVFGPWSGSIEGPDRLFKLTQSLEIPSIECFHNLYTYFPYFLVTSTYMCHVRAVKDRRGHLVEWLEKSSFARLNKLFEIDQSE